MSGAKEVVVDLEFLDYAEEYVNKDTAEAETADTQDDAETEQSGTDEEGTEEDTVEDTADDASTAVDNKTEEATNTVEAGTTVTDSTNVSTVEEFTPRERALLAQLEEANAAKLALQNKQSSAAATPADTGEADTEDFIGDADVDELLSDKGKLNNLLNTVYRKAVSAASTRSAEQIMRTLPDTISTHYRQQAAQRELVKGFYDANPDLSQVKRTVAGVANDVAAEHPEYTLDQVFSEAATRTRKLLGLRAAVTQKETKPKTKPAFAGQQSGGRRTGVRPNAAQELNSIADEIDAMANY